MRAIRSREMATMPGATRAGRTMQLMIRLLAATVFVMAPGLAPASADVLPAARYLEAVHGGQNNDHDDSTTLGTEPLSPSAGKTFTATIGAGGISLSAQGGGGQFYRNPGIGLLPAETCARATCYVDIVGPAGDGPLNITGSGNLNAFAGNSHAWMIVPGGDNGATDESVSANTPLLVYMAADVDYNSFGTIGQTDTATITAPAFTIDPGFPNPAPLACWSGEP